MKTLAAIIIIAGVWSCGRETKEERKLLGASLAPASIEVPDGALAIPGTISITATDDFMIPVAKSLLLNNAPYTDASSAILVQSTVTEDAEIPMVINLDLNQTQLNLLDTGSKLMVVYNVINVAAPKDNWGYYEGDQLSVKDGVVTFSTKHFGHFQGLAVENN